MKLTQQIHNVLNRAWSKGNGRRVTTAILLWAGLTVAAMAVVNVRYFRVVNGIPHLPLMKSYTDVTSPKPGAIVFDSLIGAPYLYTGKAWISMCTIAMPHYAADSVKWFQVVNGIPCLPIQSKVTGASIPGTFYFPTDSTGVQVNDGTAWSALGTFMTKTNVSNGSKYTRMGAVTGITGAFVIPIRSAPPTVTTNAANGTDAGTIYIDSLTADLKCYNGTTWQSLDCTGCPPNVAGITVGGDFAKMLTSNDFKTVGYAYYDKDGSAENTAPTLYRWFLSTAADGTGTTTALYQGTDKTHTFSYVDSLDGKYLNVGVTAFANTGISTSPETVGHWLLSNCPPQVTGVTANGDLTFGTGNTQTFTAGYSYYDKEGNAENSSMVNYQWLLYFASGGYMTLGTAATQSFTYTDAADSSYLALMVNTKASTGFAQSDTTMGVWLIHNCPPQVTGVTVNGDFAKMSSNNFTAGYAYYDKESNPENTTGVVYRWWLSATAGGAATGTPTTSGNTYTYADADDGKYINVGVTVKATIGFSTSTETVASALVSNCPPQVGNVRVAGTLTSGNVVSAEYSYYDKEGNAEGTSTYQWYRANSASGAGQVAISGATSATYTLTAADKTFFVGVMVIPKTAKGYSTGTEKTGWSGTVVY
jgi:hypothetical protein